MQWFIDWFNSLKPWVLAVSIDDAPYVVFSEYFREDEANRVYKMVRDSKPVDTNAPVRKYRLLSRKDWNNLLG
jgi:hypothetical protein